MAVFIGLNMIIVLSIGFFLDKNEAIFKIDKSKEILILGNSISEISLNDSIISHSENVSQSGDAYFYTYIKLRAFLNSNKQFKRVIINYPSLSFIHNKYYFENMYVLNKFPKYYYLMNTTEMYGLFTANPKSVLRAIFTIPIRYLPIFLSNRPGNISYKTLKIGNFFDLDRDNLVEDRIMIANEQEISNDENFEFSEIQKRYLIDIYNLCEQNNVDLVLFVPPVDSILRNKRDWIKRVYVDFYNQNLSKAILFDYLEYELPDSCRADCEHVNLLGAKIISEEIEKRLQFLN